MVIKGFIQVNLDFSSPSLLSVAEDSEDGLSDGLASINKLIFHCKAENLRVLFNPIGSHFHVHLNVPQLQEVY